MRQLEVIGEAKDAASASAEAVLWRPRAIVGGHSDGRFGIDNIYHFLDESLHSVWFAMNLTPADKWIVLPHRPSSIATRRFAYFFGLLPGAVELLHFDGVLRSVPHPGLPLKAPGLPPTPEAASARYVCFDDLVHDEPRNAMPISPAFYQSLATASRVCVAPPADGVLRLLVVQRVQSRRILNLDLLLASLRHSTRARLPRGFRSRRVTLVSWERLSLEQQMATACGNHVLVAAHGAGNQWSKFLNGARPERMAALLELALDDWGNCQYSKDFLRRGYVAACQSHPRAHPERHEFWSGIKFDDLIVRVDNVSRGVDALIESLASRLMWRTEGAP